MRTYDNLMYNIKDFLVKQEKKEEEMSRQKEAYQDKLRKQRVKSRLPSINFPI